MIMELFQDKINNSDDHIKWKADAIRHANSIICVSENTKTDLLKFFPQVEDKISVIYEGSEVSYNDSLGNEPVPKEPYFLYVGSRAVYKNFHLLLQAFPKVLGVKKNLKLGIVGSPLSTEEKKLIGELGINENIEYFGYVSSQHLAKLYRCSIALVYPSLYEGFGLPPLEAMTCGTAVIAANISSVPEIVGDAGLLIDPYSETELIDSMLSLLQDSSAREKLIQNGISRAKNFSWDDNVNKIVDLYRLYSK
jgi:glycosyltransferase involved in cell wall biosynthesis